MWLCLYSFSAWLAFLLFQWQSYEPFILAIIFSHSLSPTFLWPCFLFSESMPLWWWEFLNHKVKLEAFSFRYSNIGKKHGRLLNFLLSIVSVSACRRRCWVVGGPEMKAFQAPTFFYYNSSELSDFYSIHLLSLRYYSISFIVFFFSPWFSVLFSWSSFYHRAKWFVFLHLFPRPLCSWSSFLPFDSLILFFILLFWNLPEGRGEGRGERRR